MGVNNTKLTQAEWNELQEVSLKLQILDPKWLYDLINFESNWDPQAKNLVNGKAKGLIQWMPDTARDMGYPGGSQEIIDKYPDRKSQLRYPVVQYLRGYAPFNTEQSLYMAVFFPVARHVAPYTTFKYLIYNKVRTKDPAAYYANFKNGNPGIKTVVDYMNYLKKKPMSRVVSRAMKTPATYMIIGGLTALWYFLKRK